MTLFDYLIPFALALGLLILVHELGHYLVARWCGVKVLRFSIGFGKPLLRRTAGRDGTEWVLAAFPLGGYVKMLDEREAPVAAPELHRAFNRQSVYRRFAIVAAGPLANFLLAIALYWGLFVAGTEELKPRVTLSDTPAIAQAAGVREGDLVVAVDEEPVRSWQDLRWVLLRHALDSREVMLRVRTLEDVEAFRRLDLSGVAIDEGGTDLIARLGLRPWRPAIPAVIGRVAGGSAAERAGLQDGDRVLAIAGTPVVAWSDLVRLVREAPGRALDFEVERGGEAVKLVITPEAAEEGGAQIGRIGVGVAEAAAGGIAMFGEVRYGVLEGLSRAVQQTWETSVLSLKMIGRMLTGEVSWKNLSGPVTIADYAGQTAQLGWTHYLKFVALISISLGVLNLLPIPVLDGGHLLFYFAELLAGRPVPEKIQALGYQVGLFLVLGIMFLALYNDFSRL